MNYDDYDELLELLRCQGFEAEACTEPFPVLTQSVVRRQDKSAGASAGCLGR